MKVAFFHNPKAGEGSLHAKDIIRRLAAASTAQPVSAAASERGSDYDDYLSLLPRELQRLCLQKGLQDESPGLLPWLQSDKCVEGKPYSKSRRTITNIKTARFSKLWEQSRTQ